MYLVYINPKIRKERANLNWNAWRWPRDDLNYEQIYMRHTVEIDIYTLLSGPPLNRFHFLLRECVVNVLLFLKYIMARTSYCWLTLLSYVCFVLYWPNRKIIGFLVLEDNIELEDTHTHLHKLYWCQFFVFTSKCCVLSKRSNTCHLHNL